MAGSLDLLVMASTIMPTLKKVNVGIAVVCSAATWPRLAFKDVIFRAGGTRYHDKWASIEIGKWTRKLWFSMARSMHGVM